MQGIVFAQMHHQSLISEFLSAIIRLTLSVIYWNSTFQSLKFFTMALLKQILETEHGQRTLAIISMQILAKAFFATSNATILATQSFFRVN